MANESGENPPLSIPVPETEVSPRPRRRRFTAAYKLQILRELDACTQPGEKARFYWCDHNVRSTSYESQAGSDRNGPSGPPPAQIPACRITALGSYLG